MNDSNRQCRLPRSTGRCRVHAGGVLICVLACLAISTAMVTTAVQSALRMRSEARQQGVLRQTELLVEAGVGRAARRLRADASYNGESWSPEGLPSGNAEVEISVESTDAEARVEVVARYPANSPRVVQRSHTFEIGNTSAHQSNLVNPVHIAWRAVSVSARRE